MSHWESDRSIDEHYDEWCESCKADTEHCMGECLACIHKPSSQGTSARPGWPPKPALVKKNISTVQNDTD